MPRYVLTLLCLLWASAALANCVTLDISAWTPAQRTHLEAVATAAASEPVDPSWVPGQVGTLVRLCARTADISGLTSVALQTAAQTLAEAQAVLDAERAAQVTEIETSPFCRTATLQQINDRLDEQRAFMLTDIAAITNIQTAREQLTLIVNRLIAIEKAEVRCFVAYMRHQQQEN